MAAAIGDFASGRTTDAIAADIVWIPRDWSQNAHLDASCDGVQRLLLLLWLPHIIRMSLRRLLVLYTLPDMFAIGIHIYIYVYMYVNTRNTSSQIFINQTMLPL